MGAFLLHSCSAAVGAEAGEAGSARTEVQTGLSIATSVLGGLMGRGFMTKLAMSGVGTAARILGKFALLEGAYPNLKRLRVGGRWAGLIDIRLSKNISGLPTMGGAQDRVCGEVRFCYALGRVG